MIYVTQRYSFSAAHQLMAPHLSIEENKRLYGVCCYTHGHDYILEITWKGIPHSETGRVLPEEMTYAVREKVIDYLDRSYLNKKSLFLDQVPTGENILRQLWTLIPAPPEGVQLHRLHLWETRNNSFEYYGEQESVQPEK